MIRGENLKMDVTKISRSEAERHKGKCGRCRYRDLRKRRCRDCFRLILEEDVSRLGEAKES